MVNILKQGLKIPRLNGRPGSTPGTRTINKKSPSSDGLFLCLLVGVEHIAQILREIFFASNFLFLFRVKDKQLMQHVFKIDWVRGLID